MIAVVVIIALILVLWGYTQFKWQGIKPRDIETRLSPHELRAIFEQKVCGSTWKIHDAGNPMIAMSRLVGGVRQQIGLGIVETDERTHARMLVTRVTFKLTGPNKAYTLRIRMSAFVAEVRRRDPSARIVELPPDKNLSLAAFPNVTKRATKTNSTTDAPAAVPPAAQPDQNPSDVAPNGVAAAVAEPTAVADEGPDPAPAEGADLSDAHGDDPPSSDNVDEAPSAGWYPDPHNDDGALRFWDGTVWTDYVNEREA